MLVLVCVLERGYLLVEHMPWLLVTMLDPKRRSQVPVSAIFPVAVWPGCYV